MKVDDSTIDDDNAVLARIALELESAAEPNEVIRRYCEQFPQLAERIRGLCQTWLTLQEIAVESSSLDGMKLGSFTLEKWIGQGMCVVYAATEDPPLNRRVAVKIMRPERHSSAKAAKRFELEQELLARLNEPHIVPIFQSGYASGLQYFVMPLIEGASLGHVARAAHEMTTSSQGSTCPSVAELARSLAHESNSSDAKRPSNNEATTDAILARGSAQSTTQVVPANKTARFGSSKANSLAATRTPLRLTKVYFRSVVNVLYDVAMAVHHVHGVGVLHRDIKPSNIMVTTQGEARLIDLGLATYHGDERLGFPPADDESQTTPADVSQRTALVGTPLYMAPEQFAGQADRRTDVWGLGATLYELLTLRRAFGSFNGDVNNAASPSQLQTQLTAQIKSDEPPRPRNIVSNVPRDLEAICLKALRKNPSERHQTAEEFANDLNRWLTGEPSLAWPPGWNRRLRGPHSPRALWALFRRRPKSTILAATVMVGILASFGFLQYRAVEAQYQSLLLSLQKQNLATKSNGWSQETWSVARAAAEQRRDPLVRDETALSLVGWDAIRIKQFQNSAEALAFDATGKRLLMGGWAQANNQPARLWDRETDRVTDSQQPGSGPVTFDAQGAPLQLVFDPADGSRLILWDIGKQEARRSFQLTTNAGAEKLSEYESPLLAMSPHGVFVAASAVLHKGVGVTAVWETASGREVHRENQAVTAIAFSPDDAMYAVAADAHVVVRSATSDQELARLATGRATIYGMAFGRDPRPVPAGARPNDRLRLAVGRAGSLISVWNLRDGSLLSHFRGSNYDVTSVDFSPDGTLLASSGRQEGRLWDTATGRLLLNIRDERNVLPAVRFSPDGTLLALSAVPMFGSPGGVDIWKLENDRGIKTLHGLAAPVGTVCYSPDERYLAALSQDWQVGIWELPGGKLRHVLDVPQGAFADNAAQAFSADGSRFAFSTGNRAVLWDVTTGQVIKQWELPTGLGDHLAFHSSGKLLSVRFETEGKELPPYTNIPWEMHPRVVRLRNLLGDGPEQINEIKTFNHGVSQSTIARDGSYFVLDGVSGPAGGDRSIRAYDGPTGKELWAVEGLALKGGGCLKADPTGRLLAMTASGAQTTLVKMPSGQFHGVLSDDSSLVPTALGPNADYWVRRGPLPRYGYELRRSGSSKVLVNLGIDIESAPIIAQFNARGTHLAWGNADGTVSICDLRQVQTRLTELGFGW